MRSVGSGENNHQIADFSESVEEICVSVILTHATTRCDGQTQLVFGTHSVALFGAASGLGPSFAGIDFALQKDISNMGKNTGSSGCGGATGCGGGSSGSSDGGGGGCGGCGGGGGD